MLETDAITYKCPFTNTNDCIGESCMAWKTVVENPVEGYCTLVGEPYRAVPELTVKRGNSVITSGDSYDFGTKAVDIDSIAFVEFILSNIGIGILKFTDTPKVTLTGHTTDFKVVQDLSEEISEEGSQKLKISFKASTIGARSATISITNNDLDNTPFTISLTGTGV